MAGQHGSQYLVRVNHDPGRCLAPSADEIGRSSEDLPARTVIDDDSHRLAGPRRRAGNRAGEAGAEAMAVECLVERPSRYG